MGPTYIGFRSLRPCFLDRICNKQSYFMPKISQVKVAQWKSAELLIGRSGVRILLSTTKIFFFSFYFPFFKHFPFLKSKAPKTLDQLCNFIEKYWRTCQTALQLFWTSGNQGDLEKYFELPRHSRTCKTSRKLFWTFRQSRRLLKIIEKYFEASKKNQDLSNFKKIILDLQAIQESFKNHR